MYNPALKLADRLQYLESFETNSLRKLRKHTSGMWNIDTSKCIILSPLSPAVGAACLVGTQVAKLTVQFKIHTPPVEDLGNISNRGSMNSK